MFYLKLNFIVLVDMLVGFKNVILPKKLRLVKVVSREADIKTFYFEPTKPFDYKAGQYGIWFMKKFVKGKPARLFTIASAPSSQQIELTTRISHSDFKQKLASLTIGDVLYLFAPVGRFTLPVHLHEPIVLVAGGIGITPFHSMITNNIGSLEMESLTLIHVAHEGEHSYKSELAALLSNAHFIDRTTLQTTLEQIVSDRPTDTIYYVSGPPKFVQAQVISLRKLGVSNIRIDGFLGY